MARIRPVDRRAGAVRLAAVAVALVCGLAGTTSVAGAADSWPSETAGGAATSANMDEAVISAANAGRAALVWSNDDDSRVWTAPTVVNGKIFRVVSTFSANYPSPFQVRSARTGALLWSLTLPGNSFYDKGVTVDAGRALAFVSFQAFDRPHGVYAIDLVRHRIAWTSNLPAPRTDIGDAGWNRAGAVVSDGSRIYVRSIDNAVNAFRITDGARLWTVPLPVTPVGRLHDHYGTAAAGGVVYVGTSQALRAYSATTGARLWEAPAGAGRPVVAGGRVFVARAGGVSAFAAGGCGAATCPALWNRTLGGTKVTSVGADPAAPRIGGVTSTSLFATWFVSGTNRTGMIARLSASTGAVLWSAPTLEDPGTPSRAGNTVWLIANPGAAAPGRRSVVAWSAVGSRTTPLFTDATAVGNGAYGGIAVAGGSVVVQSYGGPLLVYRVPGT